MDGARRASYMAAEDAIDSNSQVEKGVLDGVAPVRLEDTTTLESPDHKRQPSGLENFVDPRDQPDPESTNAWTQRCPRAACSGGTFLFVACLYVIVQSAVVTGFFSANLSSIEKRYGIPSVTLGLLAATYDIVVLVLSPLVSYYGGRHSIPRTLSWGLTTLGVGAFMFSMPKYIAGYYNYPGSSSDYCTAMEPIVVCRTSAQDMIALFFLAQIVIAAGSSPLYSLTPAYFDQVVEKKKLSMYLGAFYATAALGPALGYLLGGVFLAMYVDPGRAPDGASSNDQQWVGAWWIGLLLSSIFAFIFCVPLFMYPKYLPNTQHIRDHNKREALMLKNRRISGFASLEDGPAKFWPSCLALIKNKVYVFNCAAQATEAFVVSGFSAFLPKAVQSLFGLSPSNASFAVGAVVIPGAAGGIFFGGWLMKRLKMSAVGSAVMCYRISFVSLLLMLTFFIGCDTVNLAGVTTTYTGNTLPFAGGVNDYQNLTASCNAGCKCDPDSYIPVCGDDSTVYFSGCHAGCAGRTGSQGTGSYFNCSCITTATAGASGGAAVSGKCTNGCNSLPAFLFMLFLVMFINFMANVPSTAVILRCLDNEHRALGMGGQNMVFRILGTIPGPIVFGAVIDNACKLWGTSCGSKTSCQEYDNWSIRRSFVLMAVIPKLWSLSCFFLSYWFFRSVQGAHLNDDQRKEKLDNMVEAQRREKADRATKMSDALKAMHSESKGASSSDVHGPPSPRTGETVSFEVNKGEVVPKIGRTTDR